MKRQLRKIATLAITSYMIASMVGCSTSNPAPSSKPSDPLSKTETLKLDVYSSTANNAGPQVGWFGKYVKDKFNIELNIIAPNIQGGDAKFATLMSSGKLGDIVILGYDSKYEQALKAGLLLDLTKDDLLNKYGKDIVSSFPKTIEKNKEQNKKAGADENKIYGIGDLVSTMSASDSSDGPDLVWGPYLRWDLYSQAGKPAINTMEDYLPVLQQMQKLQPKSESGKKTYAFSMWPDWDGNMMMCAKQFACMYGYDELGFLLVSGNEEKYEDILDPKGFYLRTLKLYNEANKLGLVDPDSISQKFENASSKMKDGQILFSWFSWFRDQYNSLDRVNQGKGFAVVPFKEEKVLSYGFANYGDKAVIGIGSKTKSPERVMEFLNWMYTPEGVMTHNYGPRGLAWDVKDGKPYQTDFGKKVLKNNSDDIQVPAEYGTGSWKSGNNQMNIKTVNYYSINPEFNEPYYFDMWSSTLADTATKLDQDWRSAMNASNPKDYFVKNNMITVSPSTLFVPGTPDSKVQQKLDQIKSIIVQNSWKMVFAKDDAEYNSLLNDMTTKAKGLGYDEVNKFYIEEAKKTFEARKAAK